ncbi:MAG: hypothetical protein OXR82_04085 [Gammaproteobacteria bacterium]|nr:hypothetical protein [Gammaproteobacteria bacterium]MDE0257555.1 hypothetical protein [Gammaproteobacteria bacterium]
MRGAAMVLMALVATSGMATRAAAQDLADFDYEHLSLRGIGFEAGYLPGYRIHGVRGEIRSLGARLDLGYLGPGLRIAPSVTYWSSELEAEEVSRLETRLGQLIAREVGPSGSEAGPEVDLGRITWSDLVVGVDAHVVWNIPFGWLSFLGLGASVHVLDGQGEAVDDTFIEDLLDTARPGVNVHLGLEYPLWSWSRLYWHGRYEVTDDLRYFNVRGGLQLMFGGTAPGEMEPR